MKELTREQKKDYAKTLFLSETGITQKEVASRAGVTEATVSRWVRDEKWEAMRVSLLTTKEEQLTLMYRQIAELNAAIAAKEEGKRYAAGREADTLIKLAAAISKLETETNIGDKIATGREFLLHVRRGGDVDIAKQIATLFNSYIKVCLK